MRIKNLKFCFIIFALLFSCNENEEIKIKFSNKSQFNIDKLIVSLTNQFDTISLKKESDSKVFKYQKDKRWAEMFSDPTLLLSVKKYSDSNKTHYNYKGGVALTRSKLSTKDVNEIFIYKDSIYGFSFRINY